MTPIAWWVLAGCFPRYPDFPGRYGTYSYDYTYTIPYPSGVDTGWDHTEPPDTDSGTAPACEADVARLSWVACFEASTALPDGEALAVGGAGVVTESGTLSGPVEGSRPVPGFDDCGPDPLLHQVRWLDAAGVTWTLGWDLEGPVDDDAPPIPVGTLLFFFATSQSSWSGSDVTVSLSDSAGSLFSLEKNATIEPGIRGFDVTPLEETCSTRDASQQWEWTRVEMGSLLLWPGESGRIGLADRSVQAVLGDWSYLDPCPSDWCGDRWWVAFAVD